jgi:hypothetical protein
MIFLLPILAAKLGMGKKKVALGKGGGQLSSAKNSQKRRRTNKIQSHSPYFNEISLSMEDLSTSTPFRRELLCVSIPFSSSSPKAISQS